MIEISVTTSGPIPNGDFGRAVEDYIDEAVWAVTKYGRGQLGIHFIKHFKEPTGYYESQVTAVRPDFHHVGGIHDGSVIYSHWLEGSGSRNFPVTRFKGYWSFKTVAADMQRQAVPIAESVLPPFLTRMRGGLS